ncbi:MAG: Methyltransferase protein, partial [Rhizobacter sp.]|nr:Methyltransferase protein [Rhizobacter sp.]
PDTASVEVGEGASPRDAVIFLHVATLGRYQYILDEALAAIRETGALNLVSLVSVQVVGDGALVISVDSDKIELIRNGDDVTVFEHPTLAAMRAYGQTHPDSAILYLNCLGGRYTGEPWDIRAEWRRMLYAIFLADARRCIELASRFDLIGVDWSLEPMPHMASNNWWARGDYLASLPQPELSVAVVGSVDLSKYGEYWTVEKNKQRHAGEFWLGLNSNARPYSAFPLKNLGLPASIYRNVPWWELPGIRWQEVAAMQRGHGSRLAWMRFTLQRISFQVQYKYRSTKSRIRQWIRRTTRTCS